MKTLPPLLSVRIARKTTIENMAQSTGASEYTDCFSYNECRRSDTKKSNGESPVMLGLWRIRSTPLLLSLPGSLWPRLVAPDKVLFMGQIELFDI